MSAADPLGDAIKALESLRAAGGRVTLPPEVLSGLREQALASVEACALLQSVEALLKQQAARAQDAFEITSTDSMGRKHTMTVRRVPGGASLLTLGQK